MTLRRYGILSLAFLLPLFIYCLMMSEVCALDSIYTIDSAGMVIAAHIPWGSITLLDIPST